MDTPPTPPGPPAGRPTRSLLTDLANEVLGGLIAGAVVWCVAMLLTAVSGRADLLSSTPFIALVCGGSLVAGVTVHLVKHARRR